MSDASFPRGKLNANDEGQLQIAMTIRKNTLIVHFGKPVEWIGFSLHEVTALREVLEKYEAELKGQSA